jgi:hypothetical protein
VIRFLAFCVLCAFLLANPAGTSVALLNFCAEIGRALVAAVEAFVDSWGM